MTRLFVVRHGETDWNVQGRLQGSSDIPLNDNGRAQAAGAAKTLGPSLRHGFTLVCSPLGRARETAEILVSSLGRGQVELDARLVERSYGVWEGLTSAEREDRYPAEHATWENRGEPNIEGYEAHAQVAARMRQATDAWVARVAGDLVFVTHGSSARMLTEDLLGLPSGGHTIGNLENAAWSRLRQVIDGPWSLERHNVGARN